jgi:hypothetical protein
MEKIYKTYNKINSINGLEIVKNQLDSISTNAPMIEILKNIFWVLLG